MMHKQVEKSDFENMVHVPVHFLRHQWRARKRERVVVGRGLYWAGKSNYTCAMQCGHWRSTTINVVLFKMKIVTLLQY